MGICGYCVPLGKAVATMSWCCEYVHKLAQEAHHLGSVEIVVKKMLACGDAFGPTASK